MLSYLIYRCLNFDVQIASKSHWNRSLRGVVEAFLLRRVHALRNALLWVVCADLRSASINEYGVWFIMNSDSDSVMKCIRLKILNLDLDVVR